MLIVDCALCRQSNKQTSLFLLLIVLIIFPPNVQSIVTALMLSIKRTKKVLMGLIDEKLSLT